MLSLPFGLFLRHQVECSLFPDIQNLYLRTISPEESLVLKLTDEAKTIFHRNLVGPRK